MSEVWRCFVAVPIDPSLRAQLATCVDGWQGRPDCAGLRWTDPSSLHLTLAFLGATDPRSIESIAAALAAVADSSPPFAVASGGVGAFPSARRASVAWYGIDDDDGRLGALASAVRRRLALEAERRPFRPHLTLARVRGERAVDLRSWVTEAEREAPTGSIRLDRLILMRSHLGRGPARYEPLARAALGAPVGA